LVLIMAAPLTPPTETAMPQASRPASLWPASTRPGDLPSGLGGLAPARRDDAGVDEAQRMAARFDICHTTLAMRVVLLVQLAVAVPGMLGAERPLQWLYAAAVPAFAGLWAALVWLAVVCSARAAMLRFAPAVRLLLACALGALAALSSWLLLLPLELVGTTLWHVFGTAMAGAAIALPLWVWFEHRARLASPADADAKLAELQSRIRPHFLFNALNTAVALVQVDPQRAESVLEDLAELFRAALAETGASVSLDEEVEVARRYLAIEQVRFGTRMQVSWQLDAAAGAARVPPLVLQPLVENAVRHGIESLAGVGRIEVSTRARRGMVSVLVVNSVGDAPVRPGTGMALKNVRERLRLLHDLGGTLDTWRDGATYRVRMVVPL
jgi:two-component system, LytTR family, sensor histidine kinase AlgZ